jgi:outer membrane beta-barrel protein
MKNHGNCHGLGEPGTHALAAPRGAEPRGVWRITLVGLACGWLFLMAAAWSDADAAETPAPREEAAANGSDEYSFSWLDPDKKIYVLQNRRYLKAGKVMLSLLGGTSLGNPFRNSLNIDPRVAYYFSEAWGFEVFYTISKNTENNTLRSLGTASGAGALPRIRENKSQYGIMLHWVPWYAKINMFNKILYFDWYLGAGVGTSHTGLDLRNSLNAAPNVREEDKFTYFWATGHQFHVSERFSIRLDFTGSHYQAPVLGDSGDNVWFSNYNVGFGLGVRI